MYICIKRKMIAEFLIVIKLRIHRFARFVFPMGHGVASTTLLFYINLSLYIEYTLYKPTDKTKAIHIYIRCITL